MKYIRNILAVAVLAVLICVSVAAADVTVVEYSLVEMNAETNGYDVNVNVKAIEGEEVRQITTIFTFNNKVFIPVSCDDYDTEVELIDGEKIVNEDPFWGTEIKVGKKTYVYNLLDAWFETSGDYTQCKITAYTTDWDQFDQTDLDVMTAAFKLADGVTPDSLKASDFVINEIQFVAGEGIEYGYNCSAMPNPVTFINKVVPAPTVITIPVLAGDIVYLQNGTSSVIAADNDAYEVPADVGYVAVNTGYDAQKTYYIDGASANEVHNGAIISTDEKQLRGPDEKSSEAEDTSGLRFLMNHNPETRKKIGHEVTKIGVLMTVESDKVKASLGEGFDFDHLKVEQAADAATMAYVKKGYAFHAEDGVNKVFGKVDQAWVISAVMYNITINAKNVKTTVVCRPFYEVDGTVIYGETMKCSLYEAADAISKTEAYESFSEEKKTYVQSILNAAGDTLIEENDIVIDISGLYTPKSN